MFIVATWNVNSIRARLEHLKRWLKKRQPEVVCLQETKARDEDFPYADLKDLGYHVAHAPGPGRNGVAILSLHPLEDVQIGFPDHEDPQARERLLAATVKGLRIHSVYVPNGGASEEAFLYKLEFFYRLREYLEEHYQPEDLLLLCGDFNVAPTPLDVYDPELLEGQVCFHPREREAFKLLLSWGLYDAYRLKHPDQARAYTWWDYQFGAFKANRGMRLDHILISKGLAPRLVQIEIDREPRGWKRPSDHTPVWAGFDL